jgi:hypothetical protein
VTAISRAAQEDPAVQDAMTRIAEATIDLHRALTVLGSSTPRLNGILANAVGPDLCARAVKTGRDAFAGLTPA